MSVNSYKELLGHIGHKIVCVGYGKFTEVNDKSLIQNVAIECETCNEVLLDYNKE